MTMASEVDDLFNTGALEEGLDAIHQAIEENLIGLLEVPSAAPANLRSAMQHALLAPGKRIRPLILYLLAEPTKPMIEAVLRVGSAVEMVHTASLILDDLPCMDDADMRRSRPTTHVAFGQSTAILGAIALLTRAFGILSELEGVTPETRARLSAVLSHAVGWDGLVAGQELDVNGQSEISDTPDVENLIWLKTGVLFVAAAEMGAILRHATDHQIHAVRLYAKHFGLAFQTRDDLLDGMASVHDAGKDVKKDEGKTTLVSLFGASKAKQGCKHHLVLADAALMETGVTVEPLRILTARLFAKGRISSS
jgi:geranylgeranyl diphosphate synthase, type II